MQLASNHSRKSRVRFEVFVEKSLEKLSVVEFFQIISGRRAKDPRSEEGGVHTVSVKSVLVVLQFR